MSLHQPGPVAGLKLQTDGILLGGDDISVGGSVELSLLLQSDGVLNRVDFVLSDGSKLRLLLVKILVDFSGPVRANLKANINKDRQNEKYDRY